MRGQRGRCAVWQHPARVTHSKFRSRLRRLYNTVVQVSFKQCVHSFRSSKLSGKEKECVANAVGKYLKLSGRIQRRVAEVQASQQADFMAKQQAAHDTGVAATPLGTKVT